MHDHGHDAQLLRQLLSKHDMPIREIDDLQCLNLHLRAQLGFGKWTAMRAGRVGADTGGRLVLYIP